ncbi:MAG: TolC family protein [Limisphaerales bacterium]
MKTAVCLLASLLLAAAGSAYGAALTNLTFAAALELAESTHPDLAEARALLQAADGRVLQAGTRANPEAIVRVESAPFRGSTTGNAEYVIGAGLPVPLGNRRGLAREVEKLDRERVLREAELKRSELQRRVHGAFATALYQEAARQSRGEAVGIASELIALTQARVKAGDAVVDDLTRAELEMAVAKVELQRSEQLWQQALTALAGTLGSPDMQIKSVAGKLAAVFEVPTLEALAENLTQHPAVALAKAEVEVSQKRIALASAARVPDVNVEVLYRRIESARQDAFDIGLRLPLPFFDQGRGRLQEARAQADAAEARSRATHIEMNNRLRAAHGQLTAALANLRGLETDILPRMQSLMRTADARHAAGDTSLADVLPLRREFIAVRSQQLEALREVMQAWGMLKALQ